MRVLRNAFLVGALAATATATTPAAALDIGHIASAKLQAVETTLEQAKQSADPIEKAVQESVGSFYETRGFLPVWFNGSDVSPQMLALRQQMDAAETYGLDPADYATPHFAERSYYNPKRLGEADVEFSRAAARFVTHLASGRFAPTQISKLITLEPERPDVGEVLARLSRSDSLDADLASYEPPHPQYEKLKAKLAELRALGEEEERIVVPAGGLLKPGRSDERVPLLRQRLGVELPAPAEAEEAETEAAEAEPAPQPALELYDDALVAAVKAFQEEHSLSVDGIVGPATLLSLNGRSREEDIASIVANMERWRWMPRELGEFHILVNVPEFLVRVVDHGKVAHQTRVVVGKPHNPTPTFSNRMSHLIVNPYWNVPSSILRNEMLPEIRANPYGYFARHGYEVLANVNGRMRRIHPASVNWYMVNPRSVRVRQVPGSHNALGRIKFMFPNQHSVYLHDTPSKSLFSRARRAFSHGCVRVQHPLEFADAILPYAAAEWDSSRLERLYGGKERRVDLDRQIPVHLAYFTMRIGDNGGLNRFEDIYGYDRKMTEFLGF